MADLTCTSILRTLERRERDGESNNSASMAALCCCENWSGLLATYTYCCGTLRCDDERRERDGENKTLANGSLVAPSYYDDARLVGIGDPNITLACSASKSCSSSSTTANDFEWRIEERRRDGYSTMISAAVSSVTGSVTAFSFAVSAATTSSRCSPVVTTVATVYLKTSSTDSVTTASITSA